MRHGFAAIPLLFVTLVGAMLRAAPIDDLPAPIVTRQTVFSIPFTVPATDPSQQPAEVRLLASGDRGVTWQMTDRVDIRGQHLPFKGGFTFRAPAEGEYWFAIRTVDRGGQMRAEKIGVPELRVVVDTRSPRLDLAAVRGTAGEIVVRWQIIDLNLKSDSLKLEYQSTGNPRWQPVAFDLDGLEPGRSTMSSEATWWPADAHGVVTIKAEVSDLAGNTTVSQAQVDLQQHVQPLRPADQDRPPLTASMNRSQPRSSHFENDARGGLNEERIEGPALGPSGAVRPSGQTIHRESNTVVPQHAANTISDSNSGAPALGPSPFLRPHSEASNGNRPPEARGAESPIHPPVGDQYVPPNNASTLPTYFNRGASDLATESTTPIAPRVPAATPRGDFDFSVPPGERLRMVNSPTFELDYEVDSVGRSGIAKIELWVTRDGGRSWMSMGVDGDNRSPFIARADREGVYGYRMTVQSGSGLGGRSPQPGDPPEVWLGVDLTRPHARLNSAETGTGDRAGEIIIRYEANDAMLAERPVTLLQSAQPGGPWTTIASGLDNTGQYSWRFDNDVPDRVYVRLEVRDEAGNVGSFDAADPVSLERVLPRARLRGARPIGER